MVIREYKFYNDESDWLTSTSVTCSLDGSTLAKQILEKLFSRRKDEGDKKCNIPPANCAKTLPEDVRNSDVQSSAYIKEKNNCFVLRKVNGRLDFGEGFDESKHLNGCPLKWLYNKKLSENKTYKVRLRSLKKSDKSGEKKEKKTNKRDKTPVEVKIHKINLTQKGDGNDEFVPDMIRCQPESSGNPKTLELQRKKLAAKLNWKLHDTDPDEWPLEKSSIPRNYFPPRPMLGLKPLLSILLVPHPTADCCSAKIRLHSSSEDKEAASPSLSVKSLDLPLPSPPMNKGNKREPRGNSIRRRCPKSAEQTKTLQIPNPITIDLRQKESGHKSKGVKSVAKTRKERTKPRKSARSLLGLYYELSDKMNSRSQQHVENPVRETKIEDAEFKIRRFLYRNAEDTFLEGEPTSKSEDEKNPKESEMENRKPLSSDLNELNLVCERIHMIERVPKSRKSNLTNQF